MTRSTDFQFFQIQAREVTKHLDKTSNKVRWEADCGALAPAVAKEMLMFKGH